MDIGTLILANIPVHLVAGVCLTMVALSFRSIASSALWFWAASNFSDALGLFLINQNERPTDGLVLFNLVGNLLVDLGTALAFIGMHRFLGCARRDLWPLVLAAGLSSAKVVIFVVHGFSLPTNVVLGGLSLSILSSASAWLLLRRAEPDLAPASWELAIVQLVWTASLLLRAGWEALRLLPGDIWGIHGAVVPVSSVALLARICITFTLTLGYLWLIVRRLQMRLERQANEDPLTGVANRRLLWERGERMVDRTHRQGGPLAVLVIDVDHFKAVNDRFGHATGDALLVRLAETINRAIRPTDFMARFGGEEFGVSIGRQSWL